MWRYIFILLMAIGMGNARALSASSAEGSAMHNLAAAIEEYKIDHGRLPTSWDQISPEFNEPIDKLFYYVRPTQRYVFVSPPLSLIVPQEGKLLVIGRSSFQDTELYTGWMGIGQRLKEPGRYIIYETPSGDIWSTYVYEGYVQQLFSSAHQPLPAPDKLGLRPHEQAYRNRQITFGVLVAALFVAFVFREKIKGYAFLVRKNWVR